MRVLNFCLSFVLRSFGRRSFGLGLSFVLRLDVVCLFGLSFVRLDVVIWSIICLFGRSFVRLGERLFVWTIVCSFGCLSLLLLRNTSLPVTLNVTSGERIFR